MRKITILLAAMVLTSLLPCCSMKALAHDGEHHDELSADFLVGKWLIKNKNFVEHNENHQDENHENEAMLINLNIDSFDAQNQSVIKFHAGHDHLPVSKTNKIFATMFFCTDEAGDLHGLIQQKKLISAAKNLVVDTSTIDQEEKAFTLVLKSKSSLKANEEVASEDLVNLELVQIDEEAKLVHASFDGENYYEPKKKNSKTDKSCRKLVKQAKKI